MICKHFWSEPSPIVSAVMPKGSKVLSVQNQRGRLTMWTLEPKTDGPGERRDFEVVATGNDPVRGNPEKFIGTVQFEGGHFVVHVFEVDK